MGCDTIEINFVFEGVDTKDQSTAQAIVEFGQKFYTFYLDLYFGDFFSLPFQDLRNMLVRQKV